MVSYLKTGILVTVIAALVWIFAEAESLGTRESRVDIVLSAEPGSDRIVDVTDPPGVRAGTFQCAVEIQGSAASLDAVERLFRKPLNLNPGSEGMPREAGQHTIDLRTLLRNHPDLRASGITVTKVVPETAKVFIDQMVERAVRVDLVLPNVEFDGPPEVSAASVRLRLPTSEAEKLSDEASASARISEANLTGLVAGRKETIRGIKLDLPGAIASSRYARLEPPLVDISLIIRSKTSTILVPSVPVYVRIAPGEFGAWDIDVPQQDRFLTDVTVSGPSDLIKQIEDKTLPLVAMVTLTFEELERRIASKEAVFSDMPGVLRFDVANRTVRLNIRKREPTNGAAPAEPR